jgi:translation elongation factor P/translation initiation factor 5A
MTKKTAAKLTTGMKLDTNAGPAEITNVARSQGGLFAAKDQIVVTFKIRNIEREIVFTPGQTLNVVS